MMRWTPEKLRRLKAKYVGSSAAELLREFPGHSLASIRYTAGKLGVRPPRRDWIAICDAHKPRIVLARPVVRGVVI